MNPEKLYGRDHLMVIAAVRYCIGRMSYIVSDCADWIIANWNEWPANTREIIKRDIEDEFKRDDEARDDGREWRPLGWDCDRKEWERVRRLWQ